MSSISPGSPTQHRSMRSASADSPYSGGGGGGGPAFRDGSTRMSPGRSPRAWARTNRSSRADFDAAAVRCAAASFLAALCPAFTAIIRRVQHGLLSIPVRRIQPVMMSTAIVSYE